MKTLFINAITLFVIFTFFGCSSKDATGYYILHDLAKQECSKNPNPEEQQQCIMQHSQSYDSNQYQKTNQ
jgi:hypothetical protein